MGYTKGTSAIKKNCYEVFLKPHIAGGTSDTITELQAGITRSDLHDADTATWSASGTFATENDWGSLGKLEAEPTITTESGEEVKLNDCNTLQVSAMINVAFNDLQVTKDNLAALIALFENGTVDVLYYDSNNESASVAVVNIQLNIFPQITGNARNVNQISGTKECATLSDNFGFCTTFS